MNTRLVEARRNLGSGQWSEADRLAREVLSTDPGNAEACFITGVAALERRDLAEAITALKRAVERDAAKSEHWVHLARALSVAQRTSDAIAAAEHAAKLRPSDALSLDTLGVIFSRAEQHEKAVPWFAQAVQLRPDNAAFKFNLASSLKFLGRFSEAEIAYDACIEADPRFWKAYPARSQLLRQTPQRNHVEYLRQRIAQPALPAEAQLNLHLALAKELEDLEQPREAFRETTAGKSAMRRTLDYATDQDSRIFEALHRAFPAIANNALPHHPPDGPIFVVGMPRTGTTLVERILSSHPLMQSVGESQNFPRAVKRAAATPSSNVLDVQTLQRGAVSDPAGVAAHYLHSMRPKSGTRFIDKLPMNFLYAGFIRAALPGARVICLRRHPLDACLSNFRQLFALNFPYYRYAYDLLDTGRYYVMFDRLIAHWQRVLPGTILEIGYEDLVSDPEPQVRRLLDFCGLDWSEACLRMERNASPVSTASAVQVRRPINRDSVGRWKAVEPELKELQALLKQAGVAF